MVIIDTQEELEELLLRLRAEDCILDVVLRNVSKHPLNDQISLIIILLPKDNSLWVLPLFHNEGLMDAHYIVERLREGAEQGAGRKYVFDKKKVIQSLGEDFKFVDLNVAKYLDTGEFENYDLITNNTTVFINSHFGMHSNLNCVIPISKHCDIFMQKYKKFNFPPPSSTFDKSFEFVNNTAINLFSELERKGIAIDKEKFVTHFGDDQIKNMKDGLIFSQYNLFTSTGRPSNRFGGVNFSALNKKDGSREPFISRYGTDGMLFMIDYSAFHPRLIANLANYPLDFNDNPYKYLAKYFFKKTLVSKKEITLSKGYTFQQFYGGIQQRYAHIPYFKKVQEYIDHRWAFFENNGYVETPIYARKIKKCHIEDPSPNKLFNYILQAYETEIGVQALGRVLEHLKGRLTQPILYTYDSLLFDAHGQDGRETTRALRDIMVDKKFPAKVYAGRNYSDMRQIVL